LKNALLEAFFLASPDGDLRRLAATTGLTTGDRRDTVGDATLVEVSFDDGTVGTAQQLLVGSDEGASRVAEGDLGGRHDGQSHEVDARVVFERGLELDLIVADTSSRRKRFQDVRQRSADDLAVIVDFTGLVAHRLTVALLTDTIRRQSVGTDDAGIGLDVGSRERVTDQVAELQAEQVADQDLTEHVAGGFVQGTTFSTRQVLARRLDGDDTVTVLVPADAQVQEDLHDQTLGDARADAEVDFPVFRVQVGVVADLGVVDVDLERLVLGLHAQALHPDKLGVERDERDDRREFVLLLHGVEVERTVRLGLDLDPLAVLRHQHGHALVLEHRRVGQVIDVVVDDLLGESHLGVRNAEQTASRDASETSLLTLTGDGEVQLGLVVDDLAGACHDQDVHELTRFADGEVDLVDGVEATGVFREHQLHLGRAGLDGLGQSRDQLASTTPRDAGQERFNVLLGVGDGDIAADHLTQHLARIEDLERRRDVEDVAGLVHVHVEIGAADAHRSAVLERDHLRVVDTAAVARLFHNTVGELDIVQVEGRVHVAGGQEGRSVSARVAGVGRGEERLGRGCEVTNVTGAVEFEFRRRGARDDLNRLGDVARGQLRQVRGLRRLGREDVMNLGFDDVHVITSSSY